MTEASNCLICYEISQSNHINGCDGKEENINQCQMLNVELLNVFVLRKLLKVSSSFCEFLLLEIGSPSEWIFCCQTCSELIRSAFAVHNDLLKLFSKAEALRKKIKAKLNDSGPGADYMFGRRTSETDEKTNLATAKSKITEEIRNYYFFGRNNTDSDSNIFITELSTTKSEVSDSDDYIEIHSESNYSDDQEPSSPMNIYVDPADVILGDSFDDTNQADHIVDKTRPKINNLTDDSCDDDVVTKINCKETAPNQNQQHGNTESGSIAISENIDKQIVADDCIDEIATPNGVTDLSRNEKSHISTSPMSDELEQTKKLSSPIKQESGSLQHSHSSVVKTSQKIKLSGLKTTTQLSKPSIKTNNDLQPDGISASENATQSLPTQDRFKCAFCTRDFKIFAHLNAHQRSLHYKEANLQPYECKPCNRIFANSSRLERHTRKMHKKVKVKKDGGPYKCQFCDKEFSNTERKNTHMRGHHYKELNLNPHQCEECGKIVTTARQLRFHITLKHKHDYNLFCPICNRGFVEKKDMARHIRAHNKEKPYVCAYCGKGFAGRHGLRAHEVKVHTQDYPFECPTCNKKCVSREELKCHISRVHTENPKPFVCELCASSFYASCYLQYHQRGMHYQELNLEPIKCKECDIIFNNIETLRYHKKSKHLEGDGFACSECGKTFFSQVMLSNHFRRNHKKEKLFECTTCSKSFFNTTELKAHTAVHTKDYKFKCKLCPKGYSDKRNLERHMSVVHGKDPDPK